MDSQFASPETKHDAGSEKPETVEIVREGSTEEVPQDMDGVIREYAYRLYEKDGKAPGKDLDYWAQAAAKLVSSNVEVRDSGPWFHCNFGVGKIPAGQIQVAIGPMQLKIHLQRDGGSDDKSKSQVDDGGGPILYWAKWPQEVDPNTAAAYVAKENLTIEVKKADPALAKSAASDGAGGPAK